MLNKARYGVQLATTTFMVAISGCGYSHRPMFSGDVGTVAVPIFQNRTFYRHLERDVTEALINEIELTTPYKVVSREHADTLLAGTITHVGQSRMSRRRQGGLPQEMELRITADLEWRDLRSGRTLRQRRGFVATGRYIPARPVGETRQTAQHEAAQRLARQIVSIMADKW